MLERSACVKLAKSFAILHTHTFTNSHSHLHFAEWGEERESKSSYFSHKIAVSARVYKRKFANKIMVTVHQLVGAKNYN